MQYQLSLFTHTYTLPKGYISASVLLLVSTCKTPFISVTKIVFDVEIMTCSSEIEIH